MTKTNIPWLSSYNAARHGAALFDFSSIIKLKIRGERAIDFLEHVCTGNISSLAEGRILNTLVCDEKGIIISVIWLLKDEDCLYVFTDSNKGNLREHLILQANGFDRLELEDITESHACYSLIGPRAIEISKRLMGEDVVGLPYLGFEHNQIEGVDCLLCRYGYTGEYEYRFVMKQNEAKNVLVKIETAGAEYGLLAGDHKALDILMLEMKSVNQNRDLLAKTSPLQAGLHWMINFRKTNFIGREAILDEKEKNQYVKLLMLLSDGEEEIKEPGRAFIEDQEVGIIVHSDYSPKLEKAIGLAYLQNEYAWVGIDLKVETVQGTFVNAKTVSAPLFITETVIASRQG